MIFKTKAMRRFLWRPVHHEPSPPTSPLSRARGAPGSGVTWARESAEMRGGTHAWWETVCGREAGPGGTCIIVRRPSPSTTRPHGQAVRRSCFSFSFQLQTHRRCRCAASAERLAKTGGLAKVEAERLALRAGRLEAELTNAQLTVAKEQVAAQKKRLEAGEIGKGDFDASVVALAGASAAAQTGDAKYRQAQLDAAALNLRRQKQLLAAGSARKSDVARAEDKLAALQLGEQKP
mgnify:CR=1 FL=1